MTPEITYEQFQQLELKVARIVAVDEIPNADRLWKLSIDVGGSKKEIVAGIKLHYKAEDLVNKFIVIVNNLQPALIRGIRSEGMLLAASDTERLSLLTLDRPVAIGSPVR